MSMRVAAVVCALTFCLIQTTPLRADFFIMEGIDPAQRSVRYREGQNSPLAWYSSYSEGGEGLWENTLSHFLSPDRKTLYLLNNAIGSNGAVSIVLDPNGALPPADLNRVLEPYATFGKRGLLVNGINRLFTFTPQTFFLGSSNNAIFVYTGNSDYLYPIQFSPSAGATRDLELSLAGDLFAATDWGVFNVSQATEFSFLPGPFGSLVTATISQPPLIPQAFLDIAFGPDGLLYALQSDRIERYASDNGALIDTFLTPSEIGNESFRSLAFGPTGALYVYAAPRQISGAGYEVITMDLATRAVTSTTSVSWDSFGPILVLPVPEPQSVVLLVSSVGVALVVRRRGLPRAN